MLKSTLVFVRKRKRKSPTILKNPCVSMLSMSVRNTATTSRKPLMLWVFHEIRWGSIWNNLHPIFLKLMIIFLSAMVKPCTRVVDRQLDFILGCCCRVMEMHYGTLFAIIKLSLACKALAFLEKTLCCPLKVLWHGVVYSVFWQTGADHHVEKAFNLT